MQKPYYRDEAEREYAKAYGRGRRLLRYSEQPSPWVVEFAQSRYFPKRGRVADFACGEGIDGLYLARLGCPVVGFDVAEAAVRKASELGGGAQLEGSWVVGDMVSCPLKDESFDVVLATACFGRLVTDEHRLAMLRESHRVLRPGGYLLFNNGVMIEEVRLSFPDVFRELREKRGDQIEDWLREEAEGVYVPPSQRYDTRRGYETLLEDVGYRIVHSHLDVSAHAWGIVLWARKI